ncbi:MAG TPA: carboxypeptidase regulatory-like domain-containing protein [Candidatus Limnocylindria bacterium]|nr:carboxypeptidase regulatory-like domain-containing protein [Candidatus Limnocylindria bacterium]
MLRTIIRSSVLARLAAPSLILLLGPLATGARAQSPDQVGTWGPVLDWGLQGKHMVLLHTGKVLVWPTGNDARVWNPSTGAFTPVPATFGDLHCAAQATLADGRAIVVGGVHGSPHNGIKVTALFDPFANTWSQGRPMNYARWYGTATLLPNGRLLASSGDDGSGNRVDLPEVYDPVADTWTVLTGAARDQGLYPFMYVLPNGRVFEAGSRTSTGILNLSGSGSWTSGPTNFFGSNGYAECDVTYTPGKIMRTGGGDPAFARVSVIDMNASSPQWREIAPMAFPRRRHNLVILLDGSVMAVGGSRSGDSESQAVLAGEIWNPNTETWTTVAAMAEARMYHSTALLLPDGRVVTAGGEGSGRLRAQIYTPPYFYKGARPTITSSPASASYGGTFTLSTPDAAGIDRVALLRPCAPTHAIDMNERYVPLTFRGGPTAGTLSVDTPANSNLAPPGYYLLVIRKTNGVPSVASWIRLDSTGNLSPGTIRGRVTALGNGSAIAGATVTYNGGSTTTNVVGDYVLSNVSPGEHSVTAAAPGYGNRTSSVTVVPGGTSTLDFQLSAPARIVGRVTNGATGAAIAGATVTYNGGSVTTNAAGDYNIAGLPPGNHTVVASAFGYQTSDTTLSLPGGVESRIDFALQRQNPHIEGEVVDATTSQPIVGATVSYPGGSTLTDNLGRYRLSNVLPGSYDVTATAFGYSPKVQQVVVVEIGYTASDFALAHTSPPPGSDLTFTPVADAQIKLGSTTTSGTSISMRVRFGDPEYRIYLRFTPTGITAPVQSARLRLFCTDASDDGGSVFRVGNEWAETGINSSNAPLISSAAIARSGAATANNWVELDVTAAVQNGDPISFALTTSSTNSCYYSTREGSRPPELVIQLDSSPGPALPPEITSLAPASGPPGTEVIVTGTNFTGVTAVAFNGAAASWTAISATQLRATVPASATTGLLSVTNGAGSGLSAQNFDVTSPPPVSALSFQPLADAHVYEGGMTKNYGSQTTLRARDESKDYRFYLKFDVQGVTGPVLGAKLRLYVTDASPVGGSIFTASNEYPISTGTMVCGVGSECCCYPDVCTCPEHVSGMEGTPWTESGVTWATSPALFGNALSTLSTVNTGTWVQFDVTSAITGNGIFSFGLTSSHTNSVYYSSKEGSHPPTLDLRLGAVARTELLHQPLEALLVLRPARPNPFSTNTVISYALPQPGRVRLTIYNVAGRVVKRLLDEEVPGGFAQATWDGTDLHGRQAGAGLYLYRLEFGGQARGGKLLLRR